MTAPGISTKLINKSSYIPSGSSVYGGIVGDFKKGPMKTPTLVTNQTQFLQWFSPDEKPKLGYDQAYYSALDYLADADALWVVRAESSENPAKYGGVTIKASDSESANAVVASAVANPENYSFLTGEVLLITGCNPGAWNNDIAIKITEVTETDADDPSLSNTFKITVGKYISATDEYNEIESYVVSRDPNKVDGYGNNIYVETKINDKSNYIRVIDNVTVASATLPKEQATYLRMANGVDNGVVTAGDRITALNTLKNPNEVDLQLLMSGGVTDASFVKAMDSMCKTDRKEETFYICTTPANDEVGTNALNALKTYRKTTLNINSYCGSLYTPHVRVYDRFNDKYFYSSPDGMIANKINAAIRDYGYNFPAAGYTRGILETALDVNNRFIEGELDLLADNQINVIKNDPGRGIVIFDNQTLYATKSDLQDQNNMLTANLQIRPNLREFLKDYLFDLNDEITRSIIVRKIDLFMRDVKAQRGVSDYVIVCDDTNNSPNDIQAGILNIDLYVKFVKAIKFIKQNVIATAQGLDFSELMVG